MRITHGPLIRVLAGTALLLTTACYDPGMQARIEADRQAYLARAIPAEQGQINGIALFSGSVSGLHHAFGQPLKTVTGISEVVGGPSKSIQYHDAKAYLINGELYNLKCYGPSCRSQTGVRIGDSVERVIALHQKGKLVSSEDGTFSLSYPIGGLDALLIFKIRDGRVFQMDLWLDYT